MELFEWLGLLIGFIGLLWAIGISTQTKKATIKAIIQLLFLAEFALAVYSYGYTHAYDNLMLNNITNNAWHTRTQTVNFLNHCQLVILAGIVLLVAVFYLVFIKNAETNIKQ